MTLAGAAAGPRGRAGPVAGVHHRRAGSADDGAMGPGAGAGRAPALHRRRGLPAQRTAQAPAAPRAAWA